MQFYEFSKKLPKRGLNKWLYPAKLLLYVLSSLYQTFLEKNRLLIGDYNSDIFPGFFKFIEFIPHFVFSLKKLFLIETQNFGFKRVRPQETFVLANVSTAISVRNVLHKAFLWHRDISSECWQYPK